MMQRDPLGMFWTRSYWPPCCLRSAAAAWAQTGLDFTRMATAAGFRGKQGQLLDIVAPAGLSAQRLFVLGAGKLDPAKPASPTGWSDRGGSLAAKLMAARAEDAGIVLDDAPPDAVAELAAGLKLPDRKPMT